MPIEDKEQTKIWKIEFIDFEYPNGFEIVKIIFEVTNLNNTTKVIRPKFKIQFINDYFSINDRINSIQAVKENKQLFKTWGLVKVEEIISSNSNETEPDITDLKWAKKVHDCQLKPSSRPHGTNIFYYLPESKIGFYN